MGNLAQGTRFNGFNQGAHPPVKLLGLRHRLRRTFATLGTMFGRTTLSWIGNTPCEKIITALFKVRTRQCGRKASDQFLGQMCFRKIKVTALFA